MKTRRILISMTLGLVFAGCAAAPRYQNISVRDSVFSPGLRISRNLYSSGPPEMPLDNRTALAAEFGSYWASGSNSQSLASGEARIGNATFTGPVTVKTMFDFAYYDTSLRWRQFIDSPPVGYEVSGGVGFTRLKLTTSSSGQRGEEIVSSPVARVGFGGMWRPFPSTRIEARAMLLKTNSNFLDIPGVEVLMVRTLGRYATVRGGYTSWEFFMPSSTRSSVDLRFSGLTLGLGVHF